jgi:hypothetical protein
MLLSLQGTGYNLESRCGTAIHWHDQVRAANMVAGTGILMLQVIVIAACDADNLAAL